MENRSNKIISIVGPTASGKSDLAVDIAQEFNGEVISADSRQVYRGLNIGTGKITQKKMCKIPHHLLDIADPSEVYTVQHFRTDGLAAISDIHKRGKLPIIAGGTGQYTDALIYESTIPKVPPNQHLRETLSAHSTTQLFEELKLQDPRRAATIEHDNKRRLIRALEIVDTLGTVPEQAEPKLRFPVLQIGINIDQDTLKDRIRDRTQIRLQNGWIDETRQLLDLEISPDRIREFGLGYAYIADNIETINLLSDDAVETITTLELQYAKRQRTWFKRNKEIHWFDHNQTSAILETVRKFISVE